MVKRLRVGVLYMILAAILTATGQLLWKIGTIKFLLCGFILYGLGAIYMIKSLKREKLIVVYPLMSIGYLISMLYGAIFFYENITFNKIIAIILIIIGVSLNSYDK